MAKTHTNYMRATVWTPTMKMEISGRPEDCIESAFYALDTPERRAKCIKELQETDAKMTAHEGAKVEG